MGRDMSPTTVMIRGPSPGFASDPDIIIPDPDPPAMTIRGPIDRDIHDWSPDISILMGVNPSSVSIQVPPIS
jgi:hypothetical protein